MSRDPYIQREDEREWEDAEYLRAVEDDRFERMLEKGSVKASSAEEARRLRYSAPIIYDFAGLYPDTTIVGQGRVADQNYVEGLTRTGAPTYG